MAADQLDANEEQPKPAEDVSENNGHLKLKVRISWHQ
jgi:hypothetical protein